MIYMVGGFYIFFYQDQEKIIKPGLYANERLRVVHVSSQSDETQPFIG